jgi:catechol 2,3-dioxygenase-like lactoylglutathione lyase family enzyme
MFDHVEFSVLDIEMSRRFYRSICLPIGIMEVFFDEAGRSAGFGSDGITRLLITGGRMTEPKLHICLRAGDRESVEAAYAGALAAGGSDNGKPGYRAHYAEGYFAAFVHDPDGHNVEILCREM